MEAACGAEVPAGAGEPKPSYPASPEITIDPAKTYRARMRTSCGEIGLDLFAGDAPVTVNSFVFLAREGFYDGTIFHRVIAGFMNQCGDPDGLGTGGPGYRFEDEIVDALRFDRPGLLAMANAGPGTNGSQFFITAVPTPHLTGAHTIFGQVAAGMDVVEKINAQPTDAADRPRETVFIETIEIEEG